MQGISDPGTLRCCGAGCRLHVWNGRQCGKDVAVCAVIKADAYGHGAVQCARALEQEGATWLGVTSTEEGVCLRDAGVATSVLPMTGNWQGEEEEVVNHNLTPLVWERWHVDSLAKAAVKLARTPFPIHLKIDTGMARLGASCRHVAEFLQLLKTNPALGPEGVATHLKSAEVLDASDVPEQLTCFRNVQNMIEAAGFKPTCYHLANTAALASRGEAWNNMVLPGIGLYGDHLRFACGRTSCPISVPNVEPVLSWKTLVISLREVGTNSIDRIRRSVCDFGSRASGRTASRVWRWPEPPVVFSRASHHP
jgi:alanine racemase